jgi:hypothetical protein
MSLDRKDLIRFWSAHKDNQTIALNEQSLQKQALSVFSVIDFLCTQNLITGKTDKASQV